MGITIHYNGKLDDPSVLPALLAEARHFCFKRKWKYGDVDDRIIGTVERWTSRDVKKEELSTEEMEWTDSMVETHSAPIDDVQRGLLIQPHPECETVFLMFNQIGELCFYMPQPETGCYWENKLLFTKTQSAPLDIHISICELLHLIQDRYFSGLRVTDEGEYYETRDPAHLAEKFAQMNALMDRVEGALTDENQSDEIGDAIRNALGEDNAEPKKRRRLNAERGKKIDPREPSWTRDHGTSANRN